MSTETKNRSVGRNLLRLGIAAVAAGALTLGGVTAANAAPGDALVAAGTGVPTLTVSKTANVADGETITISGTGYDAATLSPATGSVAGLYVSIGSVDGTSWQPSAGAAPTTRHAAKTVWVHPGGSGTDEANLTGSTTSNGAFSFTLEVPELYTKAGTDKWAVFTIGAHGLANSKQEQGREISYIGGTTTPPSPGSGTPAISVSKSGTTLTVHGTGYGAAASTGIYVSVGVIDTTNGWRPSQGKASSSRQATDTFWTWSGGPSTPASGQAKLTSGTFGALTFSTASLPTLPSGYSYAVYTVGAHGIVNANVESATLFTP